MKKTYRFFWVLVLGALTAFILFVVLCISGVFGRLPSLKELENPSILQSSEVFAADGTLMGKYYTERGNRSSVSYRDISPHVITALTSTEDERFYTHSGIDFQRTFKAVLTLGKDGGGSTKKLECHVFCLLLVFRQNRFHPPCFRRFYPAVREAGPCTPLAMASRYRLLRMGTLISSALISCTSSGTPQAKAGSTLILKWYMLCMA